MRNSYKGEDMTSYEDALADYDFQQYAEGYKRAVEDIREMISTRLYWNTADLLPLLGVFKP